MSVCVCVSVVMCVYRIPGRPAVQLFLDPRRGTRLGEESVPWKSDYTSTPWRKNWGLCVCVPVCVRSLDSHALYS